MTCPDYAAAAAADHVTIVKALLQTKTREERETSREMSAGIGVSRAAAVLAVTCLSFL